MKLSAMIFFLIGSCAQSERVPTTDSGAPNPLRFGAVMAEVGRRFELSGRAIDANRFELAGFEAGEIQELFETDLPRAELPKEGPTAPIAAMADAFAKTYPAELIKAAKARDARAFGAAFARASAACNACHQASGHAFIQIPSVPGKVVPDLDPATTP